MSPEERIKELERRLAARDRIIAALIPRVEQRVAEGPTSQLTMLRHTRVLEEAVQRKTEEIEGQRAALEQTLLDLRRTQAELLQNQKLTAIGQLAAGVAHEINTPVQYLSDNNAFLARAFEAFSVVLNCWGFIVNAEDPATITQAQRAEAKELLRRVRFDFLLREMPRALEQSAEGLQRVSRIVRALKEFSHPSLGQFTQVDLGALVDTTVTLARNEWKFVADVETDVDVVGFVCVRDRIAQVILNLVVNASHAVADVVGSGGEAGRGRITIHAREVDGACEIRVGDTGTGIAPEIVTRVFEPFFTTKALGRGSGQGLSLTHAVVVEQHHGSISIDTAVGRGTTFLLRMPMAPRDWEASA